MHQDDAALFDHEIDHIIAEQHGGATALENFAYACFEDNRRKGSNIASIDPLTGEITRLYAPRQDLWADHFELVGATIAPKSAIGRATEHLLRLNAPSRVRRRAGLIGLGRYPRQSG